MAADASARGGDVGGAGEAVEADGEVSQGCHHGRTVAGTDLGEVFGEGDVADPVQPILDAPVGSEGVGELGGLGWLVLLAYGAVDVGLLFGGRAQYGGVLSLTPRYTADMVLILVVVLAGAVRELVSSRDAVPAAHAGRPVLRRTVVCVAVSVGYLVSAALVVVATGRPRRCTHR